MCERPLTGLWIAHSIWVAWATSTNRPIGIYYSSLDVTLRLKLSSRGMPKFAVPPSLQLFRSLHVRIVPTPTLRMH